MLAANGRKLAVVIGGAIALTACGRTTLGIIGRDSGTTAADVERPRDAFAADGRSPKDAAADPGTADAGPDTPWSPDSASPDTPISNEEVGPDGGTILIDATAGIDQGAATDGGGPSACTVAPVLGSLVLSAATDVLLYSMALGELNGDGQPDLVVTNQNDELGESAPRAS